MGDWEEEKKKLDKNRLEWGARVAELQKKHGFFVCPRCYARHTAATITCRKCGYNTLPEEKS